MNSKHAYIVILPIIVAFSSQSQPVNRFFAASVSESDRISVVNSRVQLTEWHERSFWSQYKNYLDTIQDVYLRSSLTIQDLTFPFYISDVEAFDQAQELVNYRYQDLDIKRQFFGKISREHNGVIGFQFLKTETMLDLVETWRLYENSWWRKFRFHPREFSVHKIKESKYQFLSNAISLSPVEASAFFDVYSRYEMESEDVLGEFYDLYELFAEDASFFTPAVARRQGYDLFALMEREIKLKEKYFHEMSSSAGNSLAVRFFIWEDYYSTLCKLEAWMEKP